jgi:hypothetical protein
VSFEHVLKQMTDDSSAQKDKASATNKRKAFGSTISSIETNRAIKRPKPFRRWSETPVLELDQEASETRTTAASLTNDSAAEQVAPVAVGEPQETTQQIPFSTQSKFSYICLAQLSRVISNRTNSKVSDQIDEFIEEAVGDVQDYVHVIFKKAMLRTSLWLVSAFSSSPSQSTPFFLFIHSKSLQRSN